MVGVVLSELCVATVWLVVCPVRAYRYICIVPAVQHSPLPLRLVLTAWIVAAGVSQLLKERQALAYL